MPAALIYTRFLYRIVFYISTILVVFGCAYFSDFQQRVHFNKLENDLSASSIYGVERFTGNAPMNNTYKFELIDSNKKSYSLLFSLHESSFKKSTLAYLDGRKFLQDAERIDNKKDILKIINHKLPNADEISWQNLNNLSTEDAEDSYKLMLEYIRFKSRDI